MILLDEVMQLHDYSLRDFGGSNGVRDLSLLESAVNRPFQCFDGIELYPSIFEKSAALLESLLKNHPFIDGNKRTGFLAVFMLLYRNKWMLTAGQEEAYNFVIKVASSQITFKESVAWFQHHSIAIE